MHWIICSRTNACYAFVSQSTFLSVFVCQKNSWKNYSVSKKNVNFINFRAVFVCRFRYFPFFLSLFLSTNTKLAVFCKLNKKSFCSTTNDNEEKKLYRSSIGTFSPNNCFMDACVVEYTIRMRLFWVVQFYFGCWPGGLRERAEKGGNFFSLLFCFDDCVHRTWTSFNEFVMRKVGHGHLHKRAFSHGTHFGGKFQSFEMLKRRWPSCRGNAKLLK